MPLAPPTIPSLKGGPGGPLRHQTPVNNSPSFTWNLPEWHFWSHFGTGFWHGLAMSGAFKGDSEALGPRLSQVRDLGPVGLMRQFRDRAGRGVERPPRSSPGPAPADASPPGRVGPKPRGPKSDRPWEAAGMSRRTWFRRRAMERKGEEP